jgi:hypothetical protein
VLDARKPRWGPRTLAESGRFCSDFKHPYTGAPEAFRPALNPDFGVRIGPSIPRRHWLETLQSRSVPVRRDSVAAGSAPGPLRAGLPTFELRHAASVQRTEIRGSDRSTYGNVGSDPIMFRQCAMGSPPGANWSALGACGRCQQVARSSSGQAQNLGCLCRMMTVASEVNDLSFGPEFRAWPLLAFNLFVSLPRTDEDRAAY